jgi:hypothetical protein
MGKRAVHSDLKRKNGYNWCVVGKEIENFVAVEKFSILERGF